MHGGLTANIHHAWLHEINNSTNNNMITYFYFFSETIIMIEYTSALIKLAMLPSMLAMLANC
mgnify:CR=1 FL=1